MKLDHKRGLRYLAEDVVALGDPPMEVENLMAWAARFRDVQDRASGMVGNSYGGARQAVRLSGVLSGVSRSLRWKRCELCWTDSNLTVHHCIPKAVGGNDRSAVTLCRPCHDEVHAVFGPGDNYKGPQTPRETLRAMRQRQLEELGR